MNIGGVLIAIYMLFGVIAHLIKHSKRDKISYRADGTIQNKCKKYFFGRKSCEYFRKDGSLWKSEELTLSGSLTKITLFYPSGRVKYQKTAV